MQHNVCPRCKSKAIVTEEKDYAGIKCPKSTCQDCGTRWFFEEDIIAFVHQQQQKKK